MLPAWAPLALALLAPAVLAFAEILLCGISRARAGAHRGLNPHNRCTDSFLFDADRRLPLHTCTGSNHAGADRRCTAFSVCLLLWRPPYRDATASRRPGHGCRPLRRDVASQSAIAAVSPCRQRRAARVREKRTTDPPTQHDRVRLQPRCITPASYDVYRTDVCTARVQCSRAACRRAWCLRARTVFARGAGRGARSDSEKLVLLSGSSRRRGREQREAHEHRTGSHSGALTPWRRPCANCALVRCVCGVQRKG